MDSRDLHEMCSTYTPVLTGFFRRHGVPAHEVRDLVQDCFTILCNKHIQALDGKAGPFLFGIARNLLMAHRRKSRESARHLVRFSEDHVLSRATLPSQSPDTLADERERSRELEAAVDKLPDRLRDVIRLVHFEGLPRAEAAQKLGVSLQTVYNGEARALTLLRQTLAQLDRQ